MILAVANVKGGVGKTTLAVNIGIALSLCGQDVLLIDGDDQRTASAFTELRNSQRAEGAGYTAVELQGAAIRTQARQLAPKYDQIVIDVGGRDTGSLRAALSVADVVLIPVQPRSFDLWAIDQAAELIAEARSNRDGLRAIVVLNMADSQGKDNAEAADYIRTVQGVELAPHFLIRRKVYPNAASLGQSVFEFNDPKQADAINKAREDFATLTSLLFDGITNAATADAEPKTAAGGF